MSQISVQKERQQLAAAVGGNSQGGSSWRQQPGKQSKPARPLLVFSPGIGKRRKLGAATCSGLGTAGGGQKFPGRRAAGSSLALGAARDMPSRACLPRKRGKQGAAGRVAEASRGGGQDIIADLPTYAPAFGLVSHFALAMHTSHKSRTDLPRAKHLMRSVDARFCSLMVKVIR